MPDDQSNKKTPAELQLDEGQGIQMGTSADNDPTCSCGSTCRTHGIISWEDRQAAWTAGYEAGHIAGMCAHIKEEFGALADASALLGWVETRLLAYTEHGESWAELVAGPRPDHHRRKGAA